MTGTTQVWFRNPRNYIRELVEVGATNIAWDRGTLVKFRVDPVKHAELYFGKAFQWRLLLIGDQGTADVRPGYTPEVPAAVYPTWAYGEPEALLEEILAQPVGEDRNICTDPTVDPSLRPVYGQEHRVVVTSFPASHTGPGRKFLRYLKELQEDYPDAIIHLHGLYSYKTAFGMGFGSADMEPRTTASKGKVILPSGREMHHEKLSQNQQWVAAMGFTLADMAIPRNRCIYNIKSALWAGQNYNQLVNFKTQKSSEQVDTTSPDADFKPETAASVFSKAVIKPNEGDKYLCDTCSLQNDCKYFRTGAVCSVPGAEPTALAKFFKSRDSETIMEGLATLVAANTRRLEKGMQEEEEFGELSPEVSKILNQVFDQGVKLAKLRDPNLRGGTKVQVNVGAGGQAAVAMGNPRQIIAGAIRELELQGIRREDITPEMIQGLVSGMAQQDSPRRAIEGTIIERSEERSA